MKKKLHLIIGARPNFIKLIPLINIFEESKQFNIKIVNTGQHYDKMMSKIFFENFKINKKIINLKAYKNNQISTIAEIMNKYNLFILKDKPDHVIVFGDINSTFACAFTAKRNNVKISHIEAGLRSFDNEMPEEINRILTDKISDYLFIHNEEARKNLEKENTNKNKIFNVGNIIINTYFLFKKEILNSDILNKLKIKKRNYILITIHRPSNVDNPKELNIIKNQLLKLSSLYKIILIKHPRLIKIDKFFYQHLNNKNIVTSNPLDYFDFTNLLINSKAILTDSGGVQEEAIFHNVPTGIIRNNTERKIALRKNINILIRDNKNIYKMMKTITEYKVTKRKKIPLWDNKVANRIYRILKYRI